MNQLDIDCIQPKTSLLWMILGLRIALFSIELGTAIWSHSLSLLAGAGHLFADLLTLGLTFIAAWAIQRQPLNRTIQTEQRLKAWIGLINGISLGAIALLIAQEAVKHLQTIESVASLPMLLIAGLSLATNGFAVYLLYRHRDRDLNLRGVFLHGVADATGALSALVAASVMYWFDWLWADAAASLLVVLIISVSALSLIRSAWQMLREDSIYPPSNTTVI
ncbi:cation diffusion facilitator family transporter [Chamaesiphon minutus]|uniref:cation diffusion facilitator family transporter n=1 Tax=Chamaesiphon minutus TaxID=1173032 RepID=UPI001E47713D|nr:cation diffusion facilitator family transporter [Chamaesiphon minutus]